MKSIWKRPGFYITIITVVLSCIFLYEILKLGILPSTLLYIFIGVLIILNIFVGLALINSGSNLFWKILGVILAICLAIGSGFGTWYANVGNKALENISVADHNKSMVSVYVLNNGVYDDVQKLNGKKIGILTTMDNTVLTKVLSDLNDQGITFETAQYDSSLKLAKALKGQEVEAIVLSNSYLPTIAEMPDMEKLEDEIVPIYSITVKEKNLNKAETVNTARDPFTIYISGIDTRANNLDKKNRSDVNLLATVNPNTRTILLVSIPRDYYVTTVCDPSMGCMNGQKDKLTHTGLHGPETTEMTLESLLGITINYNVRVNFQSLIKVVNELGGITVNNPSAFTVNEGYSFAEGDIDLNGDQALAFVRERYAFSDGDRARGRNQMRVLTGIIHKLLSPAILTNFSGIMSTLSDSFVTNMPEKDIKALVSEQLASGGSWKIYSAQLNGNGGTDFAAELGDNAYVMYPDEATIKNVKADIIAVNNGETPPYVESK